MDLTVIEDKRNYDKKKERREIIKKRLFFYGKDLKRIERLEAEIEEVESRLVGLHGTTIKPDPVKGGGSSQEDKIVATLDETQEARDMVDQIKLDNQAIRRAIEALEDEEAIDLVYKVWVNRSMSMEQMGRILHKSKATIRRLSDDALIEIYSYLYIDDVDVDPK